MIEFVACEIEIFKVGETLSGYKVSVLCQDCLADMSEVETMLGPQVSEVLGQSLHGVQGLGEGGALVVDDVWAVEKINDRSGHHRLIPLHPTQDILFNILLRLLR